MEKEKWWKRGKPVEGVPGLYEAYLTEEELLAALKAGVTEDGFKVVLSKGPQEMLRALASGDPEAIEEAEEFQRESFRAQTGVYPEDVEAP